MYQPIVDISPYKNSGKVTNLQIIELYSNL